MPDLFRVPNCCDAESSGSGCELFDIEECVCDTIPECCLEAWGPNCKAFAEEECGLLCGDDILTIPPGLDCFQTKASSQFSFVEVPIPAGFFGPDSAPFDGVITLGAGDGTPLDTTVDRFQTAQLGPPAPDSGAQVQIEMVQLNLASVAPIEVTFGLPMRGVDLTFGPPARFYDVEVVLPEFGFGGLPTLGLMQINRTRQRGGTYGCLFSISPWFIFTEVGAPENRFEFRWADHGLDPIDIINFGGTWTYEPGIGGGCSPEFVPGVDSSGEENCCRPQRIISGATGPQGLIHDVCTPDCPPCPGGACCTSGLPRGGSIGPSCEVVADESECLGDYKGDGTDCSDGDMDGIPDVLETADCSLPRIEECPLRGPGFVVCEPPFRDACNTGTSPYNNDTDGDGALDGEEITFGTDPCDAFDGPTR